METAEPVRGELLPAEYPDGTWLHLPDLNGNGYTDVVQRDDAQGHNDRYSRPHDRHWWSFHRRAWVDWPDVVRHGGASSQAFVLVELAPAASGFFGGPVGPADGEDAPEPGSSAELYAELLKAIRGAEWAEKHFGLFAHARDVADLVIAVVWPKMARLKGEAEALRDRLEDARELAGAAGVTFPWAQGRPPRPDRFPH